MPRRFIFFTWLLIIPLNIICTALLLIIMSLFNHEVIAVDAGILFLVLLFSFPFTLAGLLGLFATVWIAQEFIMPPVTQFRFICIGCVLVTLLCYFLFEAMFHPGFTTTEYACFISASIVAVLLALFFTRKYFYQHTLSKCL